MGSFVAIGLAQALIVTLGNYFGLGVDVRDPFYSVLFALLISIAFMIMVYVLVALFGNVGKGIAIIILVLSISGGGGNYQSKFLENSSKPLILIYHLLMLSTFYENQREEFTGQMLGLR